MYAHTAVPPGTHFKMSRMMGQISEGTEGMPSLADAMRMCRKTAGAAGEDSSGGWRAGRRQPLPT